MGNLVQLTS